MGIRKGCLIREFVVVLMLLFVLNFKVRLLAQQQDVNKPKDILPLEILLLMPMLSIRMFFVRLQLKF